MSGQFVAGRRPNVLYGTILAGGTLTNVIDKSEFDLAGLVALTTMSLGTITVKAGYDNGTLYDVVNASGSPTTIGPISGTFAVSGVVLEVLRPYRYVAFQVSAQAAGLRFAMPVRA